MHADIGPWPTNSSDRRTGGGQVLKYPLTLHGPLARQAASRALGGALIFPAVVLRPRSPARPWRTGATSHLFCFYWLRVFTGQCGALGAQKGTEAGQGFALFPCPNTYAIWLSLKFDAFMAHLARPRCTRTPNWKMPAQIDPVSGGAGYKLPRSKGISTSWEIFPCGPASASAWRAVVS